MNNHDRFYMETNLERELRHDRVSGRRALFLGVIILASLAGTVWWLVAGL